VWGSVGGDQGKVWVAVVHRNVCVTMYVCRRDRELLPTKVWERDMPGG
jgi:hypothetical protein